MNERDGTSLWPSLGGITGAFFGGTGGAYGGNWLCVESARRVARASGSSVGNFREYASFDIFIILGGLVIGLAIGCGLGAFIGFFIEEEIQHRRKDRTA